MVYLSLYLRWGALPISVVTCIVLQVMMGLLSMVIGMRGSGEEVVGLWSFGLLMASAGLHVMIGMRLQTLAAAD